MLKELWKYISNLGINKKMTPFDHKAIKLMNQLSFVMILWFACSTLITLINFKTIEFLIATSNVFLFSGVLLLNSYGKTAQSKHYFMIFGLGMITLVNMAFAHSEYQLIQFITTAIFPILIFKKLRTALIYLAMNFACLVFIFYYHQNYNPLVNSSTISSYPMTYVSVYIVMIVVFLISLFFRNVGEDLERKLVEKNRYLNELVEKIQSMQEQMVISEKMASLGQLTAGIAHEINNPINFVTANVGPLKRDLTELKELCLQYKELHHSTDPQNALKNIEAYSREIDPEFLYTEIETLIKGIEEGAERTRQIVIGLRNFSRVDEDDFKTVDIHDGIESTLMLLQNKIKNRIEVIKQYGKIPLIECVPGKINQVLMNILNNASDAIGEKGTITITTSRGKKDNLVISLKDDGVGMKESVKRRIFEPFYTTKAVGLGTGLGLSISYGIIEAHYGSIEINSKPGKGSEFVLELPLKQPDKSNNSGKKGF